jgi:hypothetical protein
MVTITTAKSSHAESLMASRIVGIATYRSPDTAFAPDQAREARQHAKIARPAVLVRPCMIISAINRMNASAHPE